LGKNSGMEKFKRQPKKKFGGDEWGKLGDRAQRGEERTAPGGSRGGGGVKIYPSFSALAFMGTGKGQVAGGRQSGKHMVKIYWGWVKKGMEKKKSFWKYPRGGSLGEFGD